MSDDQIQASSERSDIVKLVNVDDEITAMAAINSILEPFDNKTRRRMLEWVIAYQAELPVACIPTPSRGPDLVDELAEEDRRS